MLSVKPINPSSALILWKTTLEHKSNMNGANGAGLLVLYGKNIKNEELVWWVECS